MFTAPGIDEPICMKTGTAIYYYHFNALGSVIALSNDTGGMAETYAYSPYGKVNQASSVGNPYLFTGRRYDPETGLYYYRARYYDAESGRFLQVDPIGYAGGINLYAYVINNPLNFVDPWGLAYRQKRPLDNFILQYTTSGPFHHDRFLFDDGTESGYYDDSTVKDDPAPKKLIKKYENVGEDLQDDILKQAVENIRPKWNRTEDSLVNNYKLTNIRGQSHNCHDYADDVMAEYNRLKNEKEKRDQSKK